MIIKEVVARVIKDSRGEKTIEVSVNNAPAASSPAGKSTGTYETPSYHDSLQWNVDFLNNWKKWIEIMCFDDLTRVEYSIKEKLGLKDVKSFGANALYAFESAILKALAEEQRCDLWEIVNARAKNFPRPVGNVMGGGLHTKGKVKPTFQEFLLVPHKRKFSENVALMKDIYQQLTKQLKTKAINDEGALQVAIDDEQALKLLSEFSKETDIGVDIAASSFFKKNLYDYRKTERTRRAHIDHVISLIKNYRVFYVEDPVEENDFVGFNEVKKADREAMIVGDDLTVTHFDRTEKAIEKRSISAMIIKPNQNGSLIDVKRVIDLCKQHGIQTIMSHRSGETMDNALADYAFGFQCDFIKCGIATPWREVKLKRMIEIEKSI